MKNAKALALAIPAMMLFLASPFGQPMISTAAANQMWVSDDEDADDQGNNGNSEDHANENANENATGAEEECGSTIENSRC